MQGTLAKCIMDQCKITLEVFVKEFLNNNDLTKYRCSNGGGSALTVFNVLAQSFKYVWFLSKLLVFGLTDGSNHIELRMHWKDIFGLTRLKIQPLRPKFKSYIFFVNHAEINQKRLQYEHNLCLKKCRMKCWIKYGAI